jgi:hypothetical protein
MEFMEKLKYYEVSRWLVVRYDCSCIIQRLGETEHGPLDAMVVALMMEEWNIG